MQDLTRLATLVHQASPHALDHRRHLHRHPELAWQEHRTQAYLAETLLALGLEPHRIAKTGLWADLGEGERFVVYRADMDALPLADEKEGAAVRSTVPGVTHACGHDFHLALALGLAEVLSQEPGLLPGRVRLVFQPSEEALPSGAEAVVETGVVDGACAALACHVEPTLETGTFGLRSGAITAAADAFEIELLGQAGHASRPHLARDPILAAARVIEALHTLVSQRTSYTEPAVLAVGMVHGGSAPNVIPSSVALGGTLRVFDSGVRALLHAAIDETAQAAAATARCTARTRISEGPAMVVNDPALHALVRGAALETFGPTSVREIAHPSTGSEDFSAFAAKAPIYLTRVGVGEPGRPVRHLHTGGFEPHEDALPIALRLMATVLARVLA